MLANTVTVPPGTVRIVYGKEKTAFKTKVESEPGLWTGEEVQRGDSPAPGAEQGHLGWVWWPRRRVVLAAPFSGAAGGGSTSHPGVQGWRRRRSPPRLRDTPGYGSLGGPGHVGCSLGNRRLGGHTLRVLGHKEQLVCGDNSSQSQTRAGICHKSLLESPGDQCTPAVPSGWLEP